MLTRTSTTSHLPADPLGEEAFRPRIRRALSHSLVALRPGAEPDEASFLQGLVVALGRHRGLAD